MYKVTSLVGDSVWGWMLRGAHYHENAIHLRGVFGQQKPQLRENRRRLRRNARGKFSTGPRSISDSCFSISVNLCGKREGARGESSTFPVLMEFRFHQHNRWLKHERTFELQNSPEHEWQREKGNHLIKHARFHD